MSKLGSGIRAVFYKCRFKSLGMPSIIAKPIKMYGLKKVSIGKRFRLLNGARFEIHDNAEVTIGENCSFGQNFHIVAGCDNKLVIGSNVTISGNVFVANMSHSYEKINVHCYDQEHVGKDTFIGDYCFIGYGAVILPGTKLGKNVIVGANAVVSGEFPDNCVIAGVPAKIIKVYDEGSKKWIKK